MLSSPTDIQKWIQIVPIPWSIANGYVYVYMDANDFSKSVNYGIYIKTEWSYANHETEIFMYFGKKHNLNQSVDMRMSTVCQTYCTWLYCQKDAIRMFFHIWRWRCQYECRVKCKHWVQSIFMKFQCSQLSVRSICAYKSTAQRLHGSWSLLLFNNVLLKIHRPAPHIDSQGEQVKSQIKLRCS